MKLSKMAGSTTAALVLAAGLAGAAGAAPAQAYDPSRPEMKLTSAMTIDSQAGGTFGVTYTLSVSDIQQPEGKTFFNMACSPGLTDATVVSKLPTWDTFDCSRSAEYMVLDLYKLTPGETQSITMHFTVSDLSAPVIITAASANAMPASTTASSEDAPLAVVSGTPVVGHTGTPYSFTVSDSRFTPSVYSATGLDATGLKIDASSGRIQGTPTTAGTFPVTVTAHSSTGGADASASYSLKITGDAPSFTTTALAGGVVGAGYSAAITADGHPQFSVTAGALPAGLRLNKTTGVVSGTPTAAGSSHFGVTAVNTSGSTTQQFEIDVVGAGGDDL